MAKIKKENEMNKASVNLKTILSFLHAIRISEKKWEDRIKENIFKLIIVSNFKLLKI